MGRVPALPLQKEVKKTSPEKAAELLMARPELITATRAAQRKAYQEFYGVSTNPVTMVRGEKLYHRMREKELRVAGEEAKAENNQLNYEEKKKETSDPFVFVPESLLTSINEIHTSIQQAEGYDNAIAIAEVIRNVGGPNNFIRAVELLKMVSPTNPQIAPKRGGPTTNE